MHNREAITLKLLWRSLLDYDLWPIYLIGITNHIPFATPNIYLTLSLKDLGFSTFQTNLLVIPSQLLHGELAAPLYPEKRGKIWRDTDVRESHQYDHHYLSWRDHRPVGSHRCHTSDLVSTFPVVAPLYRYRRCVEMACLGRYDCLPGQPIRYVSNHALLATLLLTLSVAHPIQVGWASRNANTVRSRTVGAAMYNMCVQA